MAATGRMQSSGPNLQNIPIRTEQGREIRKAFVPGGPEYTLLAADYSQVELRIIAEICGDERMNRAFREREGHPRRDRLAHLGGARGDGRRRDGVARRRR